MSGFNLGDYIDVKERITLFLKTYPEGSIQFEFKGVMPSNPDMIWGIAYAYRTPEDTRPGIGHACELAVGKTTFTRGSELMNLETSAWGRAIAALGIGLGKSIATKHEVETAQARNENPWGEPVVAEVQESYAVAKSNNAQGMSDKQFKYIRACFESHSEMTEWVKTWKEINGLEGVEKLSVGQASTMIDALKAAGINPKPKKKNPDPEGVWE